MKVLIDEKLNKELNHQGYVKFRLLSPEDVKSITDFYATIKEEHNVKDTLFHTTLNTGNSKLINQIDAFLKPIFEKRMKEHFLEVNQTIIGFLIKNSGAKSAVTIHQDWNYVDEEKYSSFSVWVSLQDTGIANGCMQIIPGSHQFYNTIRTSPNIREYFHDYKEKAADFLVDVPSKMGECILFNQGIIHASRKNLRHEERISCILGIYPKQAQMLHYFLPNKEDLTDVEVYEINTQSMIFMEKDKRPPSSALIKRFEYVAPQVPEQAFIEKCKGFVSHFTVIRNRVLNFFIGKSV